MPIIEPTHVDSATDHNINLWITGETCRFYVEQRRRFCSFLELLDLYFSAPICTDCAFSDMFPPNGPPDISYRSWREDVAWCLGEDLLSTIRKERKKDPDFGFRCKRCYKNLQPWISDDVYVVTYHLEDHYRFPLIKPGQIEPSRTVQRQIKTSTIIVVLGATKKGNFTSTILIPAAMAAMQHFVICSLYVKVAVN